MRQVEFQLIDASSNQQEETSPSYKNFGANDHLTIGNLVFESNPSSQAVSQEEYYNSVLAAKQNALPISCIQERKQKGFIEAFFTQKRTNNGLNDIQNKIMNMSPKSQIALQNYLQLCQSASGQPTSFDSSDCGSNSGSFTSLQDIEIKESAFANFIDRELGNFTNNANLNGKSQIFSYTIVQCVEDELEPFILRKGISESFISLLGSNRNHFQQMMMRIGTYEPKQSEIRRQANNSLLQTHMQCYEVSKIASSQIALTQNVSQSGFLNLAPLNSYNQSAIETFESQILECTVASSVVPCIFNGQLLGFIQYQYYSFQMPVVKKLLADRRVNKIQIPNFWNEQEYNIKSEVFIQKMEIYNH